MRIGWIEEDENRQCRCFFPEARENDKTDKRVEATPFVEFMLEALLDAIKESVSTDQVGDHVDRLLKALAAGELSSSDLMTALDLSHQPTFRKNYLDPALDRGWIERTQPDSPRSPTQRYRLTDNGQHWLKRHEDEWDSPGLATCSR